MRNKNLIIIIIIIIITIIIHARALNKSFPVSVKNQW